MYLGDVAPFVAPANRLAERGHDVTYLVPQGYHEMFGGEGFRLATYPLDASARAMHADPEHQRLMRHPILNAARLVRYWLRCGYLDDEAGVRDGLMAAFAGADVVVSHATMSLVAAPVARNVGVPLVVGHLFPMMVPTREWAVPMDRSSPDLGEPVNQALWRLLTTVGAAAFYDRRINAFRRGLGQAPLRGNAGHAWTEADRTVMLVSRHYHGDGPDDWPPVTWGGFSHWAGPAGQRLDPVVDAYLDDGPPPVLVTLGTSAATGAGRHFARIASDLDRSGLRSLLLVGDPRNLDEVEDHPGAFPFAPLAQVLPRCRVAVVSGSLGTLAAALAAGVPVVVVPQLFDQVWHGGQVERLGVGVLARRARDVGRAVARIEADPGYHRRAAELAAAMAAEDGPGALADAVESLL